MNPDYVTVKIDTDRMTHGKKVAQRLRRKREGGIPWMAILDAKGKELTTSDGPGGNVGCPVRPHERRYFMEMLKKTARKMSADDLTAIQQSLESFARKVLGERAE